MVKTWTIPVGPILYGLAWAGVAPAILLWWAVASAEVVALPAVHSPLMGGLLTAVGLALMALGMIALKVYGRGLPMNAYPPPLYVATGVYGWVSHPIYVGFILLAAGLSVAFGSASGLWLVTPSAALALVALVLGYEAHDLSRRFGDAVRPPRLSLPQAGEGKPYPWERFSVYLLALLPWMLLYEALELFGFRSVLGVSDWDFGFALRAGAWGMLVYGSAGFLALLTPLVVEHRTALRRLAVTGLIGLGALLFVYVAAPVTIGPLAGFHVLWPLICVEAWWSRGRAWGIAAAVWAVLIAAACVTTGMHALVGVLLGAALFAGVRSYGAVWQWLRQATERVANSWREWRIGSVRVINHGFYTGLGGALGAWIAGRLAGPDFIWPVVVVSAASLVGAVLWAQYLEGSSVLLRPLGWYGGLIGGLLATGALVLLGVQIMPLLGALAVALPWVQAAGRLRCLVQGCCHGGPSAPHVGIRYYHSRSRVTHIAGLTGVPLYPTQLYSILSNVLLGTLLYRLWAMGASLGLIAGLYFILSAVARFVEESYRGEPQTPVLARLRLYQWLALGGFAAGILFTTVKAAPPPARAGSLGLLGGALLVGLVGWFVTGVDFPGSNRRFSRLAEADDPPRLLKG